MNSRIDIINLAPKGGLVVEVGTLRALFAKEIVKARPDIQLLCVDNWKAPHESAEGEARRCLEGLAHIRKLDSVEAAKCAKDESLDLVYLDADHTFQGVTDDLNAWWPKIKPGGILAGHDYEMKPKGDWHTPIQVKLAVDEWAEKLGLKVEVVEETAPSFYVRKP